MEKQYLIRSILITNYTVPEINITIPTAYAQITYLDININGEEIIKLYGGEK